MSAGRVLVYGGKGALGSVIVTTFKSMKYWVGSVDINPNEEADGNILVKVQGVSWTDQEQDIVHKVAETLKDEKLDAIFCVAGGWAGGNAAHKDFIVNADKMWKQSVWPSCISAELAAKHLKEGGVLVLPGAEPAVKGTAGMMGYGMAKAAIHQLVKSLADDKSGLPAGVLVAAILPVTLDTPMNRKWMPDADHTTWTTLEFVSDLFAKWTEKKDDRPANGSLIKLITKGGETQLVPV